MSDQDQLPPKSQDDQIGWTIYLIMCGAGLVVALSWLNPSASEGFGILNRIFFWAIHIGPGLVILAATQVALSRSRLLDRFPAVLQILIAGFVAALIFAPYALALDYILPDPDGPDEGTGSLVAEFAVEFALSSVPLVLIWLLVNTPSLLRIERLGSAEGAVSEKSVKETSPVIELTEDEREFWSRIPRGLGRDIVSMSAELHYLRVHTTQGDALILFAFGRALDVMANKETGYQVHRSHWIDIKHLHELTTKSGRVTAHLSNGQSIPVSQKYRKELKNAYMLLQLNDVRA